MIYLVVPLLQQIKKMIFMMLSILKRSLTLKRAIQRKQSYSTKAIYLCNIVWKREKDPRINYQWLSLFTNDMKKKKNHLLNQ